MAWMLILVIMFPFYNMDRFQRRDIRGINREERKIERKERKIDRETKKDCVQAEQDQQE